MGPQGLIKIPLGPPGIKKKLDGENFEIFNIFVIFEKFNFLVIGYWYLVIGIWLLVFGYWYLVIGICYWYLLLVFVIGICYWYLLNFVEIAIKNPSFAT